MAHQLLVVDDSSTVLRALQVTFATEPFAVTTASSSADGLAKARKHQPEVIFIDIRLGNVDGYLLCQGLKNDPATHNAKVILMGSKARPVDENRARSVGADAQITKPFETQGVIDEVKRLVGKSPTAAPNPIPGTTMRPASGHKPAPTLAPSPQAQTAGPTPGHVAPSPSMGQPSQAPSPPRRDDLLPSSPTPTPTTLRPAVSHRFSPALDMPSESTFSGTGSSRTPENPVPSFRVKPPAFSQQPPPSTQIPNAPSLTPSTPNSRAPASTTSPPRPSNPTRQEGPTQEPTDSFFSLKTADQSTGDEVVVQPRAPKDDDPLSTLGRVADKTEHEVVPSQTPSIANTAPEMPGPAPSQVKTPASPLSESNRPTISSETEVDPDAITAAARDVIERVVWEVVPRLAETMIREHIQRLVDAQKNA